MDEEHSHEDQRKHGKGAVDLHQKRRGGPSVECFPADPGHQQGEQHHIKQYALHDRQPVHA